MTRARGRTDTVLVTERGAADSGLAGERTSLAWTRTAISFAAVGGALLKTTPLAGVLVLGMSALVWGIGHLPRRVREPESQNRHRHLLITVTVTLVSLVALGMVLLGESSPLHFR
jgi:cytochrome c biogenesis protein CcdA